MDPVFYIYLLIDASKDDLMPGDLSLLFVEY